MVRATNGLHKIKAARYVNRLYGILVLNKVFTAQIKIYGKVTNKTILTIKTIALNVISFLLKSHIQKLT